MSRTGDVIRTGLRGVGQTLITLGVVVLLFCVYELYFTNLITAREQGRLTEELTAQWAEPQGRQPGTGGPPDVELGDGIAILRVPRLGDWNDAPPVVVEGVSVSDLKKGPGHIPGTALPGEVGNVVLSGHRTTYGAPFSQFGELSPGDAVVLETRDMWFTYRITGTEIVAPTAVEVTLPVPGDPTATPTEALLTLTTCHPKFSAKQRLIVSAELTASDPKSAGRPVALEEI